MPEKKQTKKPTCSNNKHKHFSAAASVLERGEQHIECTSKDACVPLKIRHENDAKFLLANKIARMSKHTHTICRANKTTICTFYANVYMWCRNSIFEQSNLYKQLRNEKKTQKISSAERYHRNKCSTAKKKKIARKIFQPCQWANAFQRRIHIYIVKTQRVFFTFCCMRFYLLTLYTTFFIVFFF